MSILIGGSFLPSGVVPERMSIQPRVGLQYIYDKVAHQDLKFKQAIVEYFSNSLSQRKNERSHRKDNERFYSRHTFNGSEDFNNRLRRYMNEYNNFQMSPLGWMSPKEYLAQFFFNQSVTNV